MAEPRFSTHTGTFVDRGEMVPLRTSKKQTKAYAVYHGSSMSLLHMETLKTNVQT